MSVVVCSSAAVKFVKGPSSYLVCQLCKNIYTNPVVMRCGHTYCMACLTKPSTTGDCVSVIRCPVDGIESSVTELVINRFAV